MLINKKILLEDLDLPWSAIENTVVDNSRWSIQHEIIFEYQGKFYCTYYSVGATEQQDESPWEYEDNVGCTEVVKKKVMMEQWVPVE